MIIISREQESWSHLVAAGDYELWWDAVVRVRDHGPPCFLQLVTFSERTPHQIQAQNSQVLRETILPPAAEGHPDPIDLASQGERGPG